MSDTSVRVAVRIRPQSAKERIDMCQVCTSVTPGEPQIILGKDKAFTFDYLFDTNANQSEIYTMCSQDLIEGTFDGYNATIFAYGQTGSGKTYTMGTGFDVNVNADLIGIIPRAVEHLFRGIEERRYQALNAGHPPPDFKVNAQFIELYNEEIFDLLDTTRDPSDKSRSKSHIRIHEDASGSIYTVGITTRPVTSLTDTMQCLKMGALCRTTASTNMNAQSSRSHAIFTLLIRQQRVAQHALPESGDHSPSNPDTLIADFEMLTAKFHFVDLAGSERLKRTGATGNRAKEGISINCGLLALGNVISSLGDKNKKGNHVPYRDSKLTRLLQDSLGGNSRTVMIACISPSDRDFMETLNALNYANRARNIQNKVMVNQDKTSRQIAELRMELQALQLELLEYKMGKRCVDSTEIQGDAAMENALLQTEINNLRLRVKAMQETIDCLNARNVQLLTELDSVNIGNATGNVNDETKRYIEGYIKEIENLRCKLVESEALVEMMRRSSSIAPTNSMMLRTTPSRTVVNNNSATSVTTSVMDFNAAPDDHIQEVLGAAKEDLKRLRDKVIKARDKDRKSVGDSSDTEKKDDASNDNAKEVHVGNGEDSKGEDDEGDESEVYEEYDDDNDAASDGDLENGNRSIGLREDLADLTSRISIQQRLIEELELSNKRASTLKRQYEEKLNSLSKKIHETEEERDKVLASLGNAESQSLEVVNRVRADYEKKLSDLQMELRKLEVSKMEHVKSLKSQSLFEKQFRDMQRDMDDLKKQKVQLLNRMREESLKGRQVEMERNKEISQLRKDQRLKDSTIKTLEAEKRQKELILKRKQEEVESLRRNQRPSMSAKVSGRTGKYDKATTKPVSPISGYQKKFNTRACKVTWDKLERSLNSIIMKKQTIALMEQDMERWIKQRESLSKKMDKCVKKKEKIKAADGCEDVHLVKELDNQLTNLNDNVNFTQDNINDIQTNIMQLEESKSWSDDEIDPAGLVSSCSLNEARYLLERCITLIVSKGMFVAEKEMEIKELVGKLHHERSETQVQRQLLQHLIRTQVNLQLFDEPSISQVIEAANIEDGAGSDSECSEDSSDAMSHYDNSSTPVTPSLDVKCLSDELMKERLSVVTDNISSEGSGQFNLSESRRHKARRKTTTPEDLLFAGNTNCSANMESASNLGALVEVLGASSVFLADEDVQHSMQPSKAASQSRVARPSSAANVSRPNNLACKTETSTLPLPTKKSTSGKHLEPTMVSKALSISTSSAESSSSLAQTGSINSETSNLSVVAVDPSPISPSLSRRTNTGSNVFSRLTSHLQSASPQTGRGVISSVSTKSSQSALSNVCCPLIHCSTATGHAKAVLCLAAVEDFLFTGSKDRTCKVWDLTNNEEILTLDGHPNNVISVKYAESTTLIYTVSAHVVKVWDPRRGNVCIKTLMSAGMACDGGATGNNNVPRQMTCPQGENNISDIAISSMGTILYSAATNIVRIWDLRMYKSVGKLAGSHQAAIMTLAVDDTDTADGNICIATGSKDHYIKVFDVMEDTSGVVSPKYTLEPPHYDGIQSLCLMGDLLFSGSRDMCIKKWDLAEQQMKQSINSAHKDWVCGLSLMPGSNCLLSGCRAGALKVWNIDNCALVGEVQAHNSTVNAITANSQLLFSASNDRTVRCWKSRSSEIGLDVNSDE